MKPEQLKVIAESQGYKDVSISDDNRVLFKHHYGGYYKNKEYTPLRNAEQSQELQINMEIDITTSPCGSWLVGTVWDTDVRVEAMLGEKEETLLIYRQLVIDTAFKHLEHINHDN